MTIVTGDSMRTAPQIFVFAGGAGTRMDGKHGLSKHMQPIALRPLLGHVLERLQPHGPQIAVGLGYRAAKAERYLRQRWPGVRPLRLPAIDDLTLNMWHLTQVVSADAVAIFFGDVLLNSATLEAFFRDLRSYTFDARSPLTILVDRQSPDVRYSTFDLDDLGWMRSVRPSAPGEPHRYRTLAIGTWLPFFRRFAGGPPGLWKGSLQEAGRKFSVWRAMAGLCLRYDTYPRAVLAPEPGLNINTRNHLDAAREWLSMHPSGAARAAG